MYDMSERRKTMKPASRKLTHEGENVTVDADVCGPLQRPSFRSMR